MPDDPAKVATSTPRKRRRLRTVTFGARWVRVMWAAIGLLGLAGGYLLIAPTFSSTPEPPQPWGLSVAANPVQSRTRLATGWFMNLTMSSKKGCGHPTIATGEVSWTTGKHYGPLLRAPTELALGIAGIPVLHAEIRGPNESWHPALLGKREDTYVAAGRINDWTEGAAAEFQLVLLATRSAGYESCYMTSPALFEFQGDEQIWTDADSNRTIYLQEHHRDGNLGSGLLTDATVTMSVPGEQPDRTLLDSGAHVKRGDIVLSCSAYLPEPPSAQTEDSFFYTRELPLEPSCASVQTFRSSDAADNLNRRVFFAGILISAAVGLLLEALVTGTVDRDEPRGEAA